jgi:hypothetical protein
VLFVQRTSALDDLVKPRAGRFDLRVLDSQCDPDPACMMCTYDGAHIV